MSSSTASRPTGSSDRLPTFRLVALAALSMLVAISLAACGGGDGADGSRKASDASSAPAGASSSSSALKGGQEIAGKKVMFIHANDAGNTFDKPVMTGADAAARMTGLKLDTQFSNNNDTKLRSIFQSGVAERVAGIIVAIPNGSLNKPICEARKAGIAVIAWNINGTTGAAKDCVMAFLGQDFVTTGEVIASRMIKDGLIKSGDRVFCPVEYPNFDYASERAAGANRALQALGAKCDVVGVGPDQAKARTTMAQYLLGHRDTKVILSLGGTPFSVAQQAVKQAGLKDVKLGGFDLTPQIVDGIKSGAIDATVDQQPYSQGFMSVMQLALYLKYGLFPSDVPTGGTGMVDKTNVELVGSLVPDYR